MTLTKEQLDKLVGLLIEAPFKYAQPIMELIQKILEEQRKKENA